MTMLSEAEFADLNIRMVKVDKYVSKNSVNFILKSLVDEGKSQEVTEWSWNRPL